MIYVDEPTNMAEKMGLLPADVGANIVLFEPADASVFSDGWTDKGLVYADLYRVMADLLTSPGRGPAEAEALWKWLRERGGLDG